MIGTERGEREDERQRHDSERVVEEQSEMRGGRQYRATRGQ